MSTKEKILDAALTLFAENGYNGTSVEQITKAVGIKAPSLYKHFKGKEDILNALIDSAEVRYEEMFGSERSRCGIRSSERRGCSLFRSSSGTKGPQRSLPDTSWMEFRECLRGSSRE